MVHRTLIKLGLLFLFLAFSACSSIDQKPLPGEEAFRFQLVPDAEWPLFGDDFDQQSLTQAVNQSLTYLKNRPGDRRMRVGTREISNNELLAGLILFQEILNSDNEGLKSQQERFKAHFDLFRATLTGESAPLLMTGYYEPTLQGSRDPSSRYKFPVYGTPKDLLLIDLGKFSSKFQGSKYIGRIEGNRVIPFFSRKEIDQDGRLKGKNLEILWVDDPLKLFFMHIQGSGEVLLENGSVVKLQYQGTNGHPYYAIGKELIRLGILQPEEVSLQSIYAYLQKHPQEQQELMNTNPSYVFFKEAQGGPYGSLGRPLTPGRSVAMDLKIFPPAGLGWLKGVKPVLDKQGLIQSWAPLERWVSIQDSGGAIKGPSRLDLYWGRGPEAETAAGHLRHQGTFFLLLKKQDPDKH